MSASQDFLAVSSVHVRSRSFRANLAHRRNATMRSATAASPQGTCCTDLAERHTGDERHVQQCRDSQALQGEEKEGQGEKMKSPPTQLKDQRSDTEIEDDGGHSTQVERKLEQSGVKRGERPPFIISDTRSIK